MQITAQENISEHEKYLECQTKEQRYQISELESIIEEQKVVIVEERAKLEKCKENKKENPLDLANQFGSFREDFLKVKTLQKLLQCH